jgi:hypothetical protein
MSTTPFSPTPFSPTPISTTVPGEPVGGPTQFPESGGKASPQDPLPTPPPPPPPVIAQPPAVQIYGSPQRIYPEWAPLNLDWLIQEGLVPTSVPVTPNYPYAQGAGVYGGSSYYANYQAYLDATGPITWLAGFYISGGKGLPAPMACQHQAQISGYSFTLGGVTYAYNPNAAWSPWG